MRALQGVGGLPVWGAVGRVPCDVGQVRIRVAAAGLNRADLLQLAGQYAPPAGASAVLGLECSGVIVEVGAGTDWRIGERVCALLSGGGMAEEVVVDARHVLPVPEGLSLPEAAALPEVYATAWLNLFQLAALVPGEKVLLHAGASGVGSAAIQLCKAFGNPCWVSVGSPQRLAYCIGLGAQGGVLRDEGLSGLSAFAPFDVILDPVGGAYAHLNLQWLALDGRWLTIGLMGGRSAELDFARLLSKRVQLTGSTLRNRDDLFKARLLADLHQHVWPLFALGRLKPQLQQCFPADQASAAFALLASNAVNGKLVLQLDEGLI